MSELSDLRAVFAEEATQLLAQLGRSLLELEQGAPGEKRDKTLREIFRAAHTLKGSASTVGRMDFAEVAHALEGCLDAVRRGILEPDRRLADAALACLDLLQGAVLQAIPPQRAADVIKALNAVRETSAPAAAPAKPAGARKRRKADRPEGFRELVGELAGRLSELASGTAPQSAVANLSEFLERLSRSAEADRPLSRRLLDAVSAAVKRHEGAASLPRSTVDAAFMAADLITSDLQGAASEEEVGAIEKLLQASTTVAPVEPPPPSDAETNVEHYVRIPLSLLDAILYRLDELVAVRLRADYQRRQIEDAQEGLERALTHGRATPADLLPHIDAHKRRLEFIHRDLSQDIHQLGLVAQGLQEDVKEVRMVPVGPSLDPFRRMVRDLAHSLGKEASLDVAGEDVRVDKRLLDLLRDPLMHILRNAVDHGLETPAERRASGKVERGEVRISAEAREAQVWIEIADDGRGISVEAVREAALAQGMIDRSQTLSDREVLNLIFAPRFTTASQATEVSGRGVGLDVVRENVSRLGGRIEFFTTPGKGSVFKLILPLTLAASHGLLVRVGKQLFCIPLAAVEEVVSVEPSTIGMVQGRWAMGWRRQTISFVALDALLAGRPSARPTDGAPTLILALSDRRLALGVEELLGQEEIVLKGLAPGTPKLPFVSGATSLGDGRLVTVLEPGALVNAAMRLHATVPVDESRKRLTILVVDDSLTSRTMVGGVVEQAGYRTLLAHDGEEALALLQRETVDVVVSDVEMPNVNGFELTQRMRASPSWSQLPVILLTSLDGPEDRARGAQAGANAFIVKKRFDPATFLGMIADLAPSGGTQ